MKSHDKSRRALLPSCLGVIILSAAAMLVSQSKESVSTKQVAPSNFGELIAFPLQFSSCDVALLNLFCAEGLSGAEGLDAQIAIKTLDAWAARVGAESTRNLHRFRENPAESDNSEAKWRMLMLVTVLQQDFGVRYNPARISTPGFVSAGDGFFTNSRDVFLHGILGPNRMGTCSSMPVLYVAVGRRLGYPLKLVTTKGHLFVRWESPDGKDRFNFEGSSLGGEFYPDEYYRHWPFDVAEAEVQAEGYLKSLSAAEELAVFLSIRGMCWLEARRYAEAAESFEAAARLHPGCQTYRLMAGKLRQLASGQIADEGEKP